MVEMTFADSGKVYDTKKFVDETFPFNTSKFLDPTSFTALPKCVFVIFTKKGGGDMLEKDVLLEISLADQFIKNITINDKGRKIGYSDICGRVGEKCFENPIIEILPEIDNIVQREKKLKYPFDIDPLTYSYQIYSLNFGGVIEDDNDVIQTVNAIRLTYFTDESDKKKHNVIGRWQKEVYNQIRNHQFKYVFCIIDYMWSMEQRNVQLSENMEPMIGAVVAFISLFTTVTCMSNNWAKSKPFLGIASVVSAGLAVVTSFGFMSAVGVPNSIWNITIPFLVLVTEIDDAFVLLACWKISNPKHKVHKRMEETLGEAGISITLTSLTNLFSYCIGMTASFPLIRMFCYYSATSVVFTFLYQITFYAGCMALSGYKEEKQQQALRLNFKDIENFSTEEETSTDEPTMAYFRDKFGRILSMNVTKITVIIVYFLNLSFGIWGALTIKHGIDFTNLYPQESEITRGIKIYYNSFGRYTFPYQIVINSTLDYSDLNVQKSVDELLNKFESLSYIADSRFTLSWLKYYKEFQNHPLAKYSLRGYNMSVKQDFLDGLRDVFLKFKSAKQFTDDIAFNFDGTDIISSRFHIFVNDTLSPAAEMEMLKALWKIADEFELPVFVHAAVTPLYEQGIIIGRTINDLFWITSLLVMILFVVIIPNIVVAVLVAISVTSTIVETLGYMSLWGINMDILSMMSLILCVGFCVNYPAHISYAYICSPYQTPNERMKDSLYRIGYPICQGSLSTILGILFVYRDMYAFIIFVKIVFLIAIETAFHALIFVPVVLSLISSIFFKANNEI
ncbi:patched domain-containing protein 3-like [Centruroides sculpturatus]|uniref:patched domain-containing protein 3-like n=1 Tax=Centruroides sculpturatus TaxID=218467 RepID=UPI000C6E2543|nr:patched domain-containing protein 3-like [Centruroides sculpturatus]